MKISAQAVYCTLLLPPQKKVLTYHDIIVQVSISRYVSLTNCRVHRDGEVQVITQGSTQSSLVSSPKISETIMTF